MGVPVATRILLDMFDSQRVQSEGHDITRITETMTAIAEQQRQCILANRTDEHARIGVALHGVMATQSQLIAYINALFGSFVQYLLDQDSQQQLGISE